MRNFWCANLLLASIAMIGPASAAETGSIRGTVVDSSGKGLRGAIVSAINEDLKKSLMKFSWKLKTTFMITIPLKKR